MIKTLAKIQSTVHINCSWKTSQWLWKILAGFLASCGNIASFHITKWSSSQNYILKTFSKHFKLYFKAIIHNPKFIEQLKIFSTSMGQREIQVWQESVTNWGSLLVSWNPVSLFSTW